MLNKFSRTELKRLAPLLGALLVVFVVWLPQILVGKIFEPDCICLKVSFIDVGQGDSILIQSPDGHKALVDGGPNATAVLRGLGQELSFFDRTIDLVVSTHPDADHIGGLSSVLKRYKVLSVLETTNGKDTPATEAFATAIKDSNVPVSYADVGQVIKLGDEVTLRVLSPAGDETNWESNMASIVIRVEYGSTSVMLTGDAPIEIEDYLVDTYPQYLKSNILKLGHHGSKTSSSEKWLDAVHPEYAVVSAGIGNKYGHPHQSVMQAVFARNIQSSHTGTDGTVIFYSDGHTVWRK